MIRTKLSSSRESEKASEPRYKTMYRRPPRRGGQPLCVRSRGGPPRTRELPYRSHYRQAYAANDYDDQEDDYEQPYDDAGYNPHQNEGQGYEYADEDQYDEYEEGEDDEEMEDEEEEVSLSTD